MRRFKRGFAVIVVLLFLIGLTRLGSGLAEALQSEQYLANLHYLMTVAFQQAEQRLIDAEQRLWHGEKFIADDAFVTIARLKERVGGGIYYRITARGEKQSSRVVLWSIIYVTPELSQNLGSNSLLKAQRLAWGWD